MRKEIYFKREREYKNAMDNARLNLEMHARGHGAMKLDCHGMARLAAEYTRAYNRYMRLIDNGYTD